MSKRNIKKLPVIENKSEVVEQGAMLPCEPTDRKRNCVDEVEETKEPEVREVEPVASLKSKPKKSEKQLEAFRKAREKRLENIGRRKQEIQELEKDAKEQLDKKIVSKAISIKKKLIKQNAELDDAVSDDDSPLEEVMKIAKKKPTRVQTKKVKISEPEREPEQNQPEPQYQQQYAPQVKTFKFL